LIYTGDRGFNTWCSEGLFYDSRCFLKILNYTKPLFGVGWNRLDLHLKASHAGNRGYKKPY